MGKKIELQIKLKKTLMHMKLVRLIIYFAAVVSCYGSYGKYVTNKKDGDMSNIEKRHVPKMAVYGKRHSPLMATYDKRSFSYNSKANMKKLISQGIRNPGIMGLAKK